MRNTDKIRFYILKTVKDFSDIHGYNLFLMLKQHNLVSNASQLYKILRSMESKKLIISTEVESDKGPDKKILEITEKGRNKYYTEVLEHFNIVADFIGEAILQVDDSNLQIESLKTRLSVIKNKKIYFDLKMIPAMMKSRIIINLLIPIAKNGGNTLYIDKFDDNPIFSVENLIKEHVVVLDESVGLKPNSIDVIYSNTFQLTREFLNKYDYFKNIIKPKGEINLGVSQSPQQKKGHPKPRMDLVLNFLAKQLPREYRKNFKLNIPEFLVEQNQNIKVIEFNDFKQKAEQDFNHVQIIMQNPQVRIIIMSEKKEKEVNYNI